MLTWPVIAVGWVINIFQRGTASMGRINEILVEKPEITDDMAKPGAGPIRGEIEFRNLHFSYNGVPVLKNVRLLVPAGSRLATAAPPGSGRPTLLTRDP